MKSQPKPNLIKWVFAVAVAGLASGFVSDAISEETDAASIHEIKAENGAIPGQQVAQLFGRSTSATPTPKPTPQAIEDLKKNPPLDVTKIGDPMPRNLFVELSKLINPAVVSISTSQQMRQMSRGGVPRDPMREFFEDFWGLPPGGGGGGGGRLGQRPAQALGTGFLIRADGLIVTNNHVIENADVITVSLDPNTKEEFEAKVVGRDARTDIALIKIESKRPLPVAPLGTSSNVQVGEWVAAFGNPYGHAHTMTKGIVSAIGREISELNRFPFIQTDASINPGNSGGPLVNTRGEVIGVNTAIDARAQGIGFAIPIDNVKTIVAQLEKDGRVRRGFIGIGISPLAPEVARQLGLDSDEGAIVNQVQKGGPAAKAGLEVYDIIVEFGGKKVRTPVDLQNAVGDTPIGGRAKVKILRFANDRTKVERTFDISVAENPDEREVTERQPKRFFGQKAPFQLGFKVSDMNAQIRRDLGLEDAPEAPVITDVERGTIAAQVGLQPGDLILDVNRTPVRRAADVVKHLRKGTNIMRIARGNMVAVIAMETPER
ncbi:MAG: trypsin-like peptidase domain-containing protein [Bdellovibrionaceae bacterium]|nr:trypsin-like peptidase domain-containing protein [Pseudobdellovibrionaceae bacterium]